jgi:hypothetical protein
MHEIKMSIHINYLKFLLIFCDHLLISSGDIPGSYGGHSVHPLGRQRGNSHALIGLSSQAVCHTNTEIVQ